MNFRRGLFRITVALSVVAGLILLIPKPPFEEFKWRAATASERQHASERAGRANPSDEEILDGLLIQETRKVLKADQSALPLQFRCTALLPTPYSLNTSCVDLVGDS